MLLKPPGVYHPQADTRLLAEALGREALPPHAHVLDVGTGTGVLAIHAARAGARRVLAVDISRRAVFAAWCNARLRGLPVRVRRGDLLVSTDLAPFDLVLANPPYVPSAEERPPSRGPARAWDAGPGGRALLDRLCAAAPVLLRRGGRMLLVQSALSGVEATLDGLTAAGAPAEVVLRSRQPFGPVMRARAELLERRGLLAAGQREEDLVVIRAVREN